MKKNGTVALLLLVAFVLALAPPALAAPKADPGIKVYVNGNRVSFPDEPPWIDAAAGRVLVPLRFVSEALGATVDWNGATRTVTVTRGKVTVRLTVGQKVVFKSGEPLALDVAPFLTKKGRTLVPLRFVSEALGAKVDWRGDERAVYIVDQSGDQEGGTGTGTGTGTRGTVNGTPISQREPFVETVGGPTLPPEYKEAVVETAKQAWREAKPFVGQQYQFGNERYPRTVMFLNSVDDLKPNGVRFSNQEKRVVNGKEVDVGIMVLFDVFVKNGNVYVKFANGDAYTGPMPPALLLVSPDGAIRYKAGNEYNYKGNPALHEYDFNFIYRYDENGYAGKGWGEGKSYTVEDFKGFLFAYPTGSIYVPNPVYKGGSGK